MNTSVSITKIAPAFLKAQMATGAAVKDAKNSFFKSSYADLGSVMESCKAALNENDITVLQPINGDKVETVLLHISGEWFTSETNIICKAPNDPQAYGSAVTYARRYGLQSMVFIPAEDDDANRATGNKTIEIKVPTVALTTPKITSRCTVCNWVNGNHEPGCPNKETK